MVSKATKRREAMSIKAENRFRSLCRLATGPWLLISLLCGKVIVGLVVACFSSVTTSEGVDIPSPGWFA
jgi:hypothetical protein